MSKSSRGGVKGGHSAVVSSYHQSSSQFKRSEPYDAMDGHEHWPKGLTNVGNTCYANAALQCLLSTALTNALLNPETMPLLRRYSSNANLLAMGSGSVDSEDDKLLKTPKSGQCETAQMRRERENRKMAENCEWLTKHLTHLTHEYTAEPEPLATQGPSVMGWLSQPHLPDSVVNPGSITKHPDRLSNCLRPYQQEDAHEFLRALISTLVMNGRNKQLSSLFDGLLESAVICRSCGRASLTRDRYMDLSLDINEPHICTLDDALYEYTKNEILDGDNAVHCQKCRKKRSVTKGLRLATAPSILVCHLKRFAFDNYGRLVRLHKKIDFPLRLEIGDCMSELNKARPPPYDLVGILVHQGQTCASGHYLAFVKKNGEWYRCNDSIVTKVDEALVLNQQAYILMYEVAEMRAKTCTPKSKLQEQATPSTIDSDDAEILKEEHSTHASNRSSDRSKFSDSTRESQAPVERLLRFLLNAEGKFTGFLVDMCCDSSNDGINEPQTRELQRKHRRKRDKQEVSESDASTSDLRKSFSSENVKVVDAERLKSGHRSQTAPRQRTHSYDSNIGAVFDMESHHTIYSAPSESFRYRDGEEQANVRDSRNRTLPKSRRNRSRSTHAPGDANALPPLPTHGRHRRAKSNASTRKKGGYLV
jgi:hypothetical protein